MYADKTVIVVDYVGKISLEIPSDCWEHYTRNLRGYGLLFAATCNNA